MTTASPGCAEERITFVAPRQSSRGLRYRTKMVGTEATHNAITSQKPRRRLGSTTIPRPASMPEAKLEYEHAHQHQRRCQDGKFDNIRASVRPRRPQPGLDSSK